MIELCHRLPKSKSKPYPIIGGLLLPLTIILILVVNPVLCFTPSHLGLSDVVTRQNKRQVECDRPQMGTITCLNASGP